MGQSGQNFQRVRAATRFAHLPNYGGIYFADSVAGVATGGYTPDVGAARRDQ